MRCYLSRRPPKPPLVVCVVPLCTTGLTSEWYSDVNHGGFWLIKEYFGMTVGQTFKTWSLLETIISVMGLALTFALAAVL